MSGVTTPAGREPLNQGGRLSWMSTSPGPKPTYGGFGHTRPVVFLWWEQPAPTGGDSQGGTSVLGRSHWRALRMGTGPVGLALTALRSLSGLCFKKGRLPMRGLRPGKR